MQLAPKRFGSPAVARDPSPVPVYGENSGPTARSVATGPWGFPKGSLVLLS